MSLAPVPWCLAWCEDGELTPQDRFDLLQALVCCEAVEAQSALIASVERMALTEISMVESRGVTGLCA